MERPVGECSRLGESEGRNRQRKHGSQQQFLSSSPTAYPPTTHEGPTAPPGESDDKGIFSTLAAGAVASGFGGCHSREGQYPPPPRAYPGYPYGHPPVGYPQQVTHHHEVIQVLMDMLHLMQCMDLIRVAVALAF
ncbi:hypothetical protein MKW98_000960 [Papaver atlanticum]|uniref:Uncharacterized protein n=1 Tax=Papaver atlanticum TaxID=357466 RepID=A0AAD4SF43_9MAGN|nr:hypothetical protein MKW98_000960 [Papaver atlanticum]